MATAKRDLLIAIEILACELLKINPDYRWESMYSNFGWNEIITTALQKIRNARPHETAQTHDPKQLAIEAAIAAKDIYNT